MSPLPECNAATWCDRLTAGPATHTCTHTSIHTYHAQPIHSPGPAVPPKPCQPKMRGGNSRSQGSSSSRRRAPCGCAEPPEASPMLTAHSANASYINASPLESHMHAEVDCNRQGNGIKPTVRAVQSLSPMGMSEQASDTKATTLPSTGQGLPPCSNRSPLTQPLSTPVAPLVASGSSHTHCVRSGWVPKKAAVDSAHSGSRLRAHSPAWRLEAKGIEQGRQPFMTSRDIHRQ